MLRFIPSKKCNSVHAVAGWNDIVTDKHEAARKAFLDWVYESKPRTGYFCEIMKRTHAQLKLALRYCRSHDELFRSNVMADNFLNDKR